MTIAEYMRLKGELTGLLNDGKITQKEYESKLLILQANRGGDYNIIHSRMFSGIGKTAEKKPPQKKPPAKNPPAGKTGGMTVAEYEAAKKEMYRQYKEGKITNYAYIQWKKKNNPANQAPPPANPPGGKGTPPGGDGGDLEKRLREIYKEAEGDLKEKLREFQEKSAKKELEMREKLMKGEITMEEYANWGKGQVFQGKQWEQKIDQVTGTLLDANRQAMQIINDEKMGVFAENANYQAYELVQKSGLNLNFAIYDMDTVGRLIREQPELLPRKVVNGKKDKAWNRELIAKAVTQGVIQGESIPDLAKRIARDTASTNMKAMIRYARTAMTGAQNAGRMETLHRARDMGIKSKKTWLATLDKRTRHSHARLDGTTIDIDKEFKGDYGDLMYPGDPEGHPGDVYNCRCTLVYEYEGFENVDAERIAYNEYTDENGKEHREPYYVKDMTYQQWKNLREGNPPGDQGGRETPPAEPPAQTDAYGAVGGKAWGVYKGEIPEDIRAKIDAALTAGKGTRTPNEYWRDLVDGKEQNAEIEALMRQIGQGPQPKGGGVNLSEDTIKAIDGYIEGTGNKFTDKQIKEITAAMEKTDKPLYRVEDAQWMADGLKVGDEFTFDKPLKGFTQDMDGIRTVVAEGDDAGLYEETLVIFKTESGTEAMDISGISRNHAEEKESLVGGKFEVVSVEDGPEINGHKTRIMKIRQIDAEEDARAKEREAANKAYLEGKEAWSKQMTGEDLEALRDFTDGKLQKETNGWLRHNENDWKQGQEDDIEANIGRLDKAIEKEELKAKTTVYRGVEGDYLGLDFSDPQKLIGKTVEDRGFMSTTGSKDIAAGYGKGVVLEIEAPKGTHVAYADLAKEDREALLKHPGNIEYLLERGCELKFTGYTKEKDADGNEYLKMQCELVPRYKKRDKQIKDIMKSSTTAPLNDTQKKEFKTILEGMSDQNLAMYKDMVKFHKGSNYHDPAAGWYDPGKKIVEMDINKTKWENRAGRKDQAAWKVKFHEELHQLDHILGISQHYGWKGEATAAEDDYWRKATPEGKRLAAAITNDVQKYINRAIQEKNKGKKKPVPEVTDLRSPISAEQKKSFFGYLEDETKVGTRYSAESQKNRALASAFTDAVGLATKGKIHTQAEGYWGHDLNYCKSLGMSGATSETYAEIGSHLMRGDTEALAALEEYMPETIREYKRVMREQAEFMRKNKIHY